MREVSFLRGGPSISDRQSSTFSGPPLANAKKYCPPSAGVQKILPLPLPSEKNSAPPPLELKTSTFPCYNIVMIVYDLRAQNLRFVAPIPEQIGTPIMYFLEVSGGTYQKFSLPKLGELGQIDVFQYHM